MKVFRELTIQGPHEKLRKLPDQIEHHLCGGWSREAETRRSTSSELYNFQEGRELYEKPDLYCDGDRGQ
jgi:hypothetical protein